MSECVWDCMCPIVHTGAGVRYDAPLVRWAQTIFSLDFNVLEWFTVYFGYMTIHTIYSPPNLPRRLERYGVRWETLGHGDAHDVAPHVHET